MNYEEAKHLHEQASQYLNQELQWSNGKELIRCRFVEISGDDLSKDTQKNKYRLFAVLQPEQGKRFTESVKAIARYFEEQ